MMLKAFLAWAGIVAARAPILRSERSANGVVHDEVNREQAIFSGSQVLLRRSDALVSVMESDPSNTPRIEKGLSDMRTIVAEVARRVDR